MEIAPTAEYADLRGSDVVVVTAGAAGVPGQSRLDLLGTAAILDMAYQSLAARAGSPPG
jgi:malate/lactate dehydrogenase